jgi:hypothetical protein
VRRKRCSPRKTRRRRQGGRNRTDDSPQRHRGHREKYTVYSNRLYFNLDAVHAGMVTVRSRSNFCRFSLCALCLCGEITQIPWSTFWLRNRPGSTLSGLDSQSPLLCGGHSFRSSHS